MKGWGIKKKYKVPQGCDWPSSGGKAVEGGGRHLNRLFQGRVMEIWYKHSDISTCITRIDYGFNDIPLIMTGRGKRLFVFFEITVLNSTPLL